MNKRRKYEKWVPKEQTRPETSEHKVDHFATRERANDFIRLMRMLPDPDPILRKMGKGISALKELLTDSHLESVWGIRCSTVSGSDWFIKPGADDTRSIEAAKSFEDELRRLDVPHIMEEMMQAVAYGYQPMETLWTPRGTQWGFKDIVGKPPEWFDFTKDNELVFKTGVNSYENLPENRFLLIQHRDSYDNPHGVKVFSKCFWPATFKKNGFRWWTVFVEKYGGAFLYGKYPSNASEKFKGELLDALEQMIADAVAIVPEGSEITIDSMANKGGISSVHKEYIDSANAEMSKATLGQTLTTEVGAVGSYAASQTHNLVRQDLAAADRRRTSEGFNRLSDLHAFYNYGPDVSPSRFCFVKDEDLQSPRADRDVKLYSLGWRPTKTYIAREYDMQDNDFEIQEQSDGFFNTAASVQAFEKAEPDQLLKKKKANIFQRFLFSRSAKKAEKAYTKDSAMMNEFAHTLIKEEQDDTNAEIEQFVDALGMAGNYTDAFEALLKTDVSDHTARHAGRIENIRYVASQLGARRG